MAQVGVAGGGVALSSDKKLSSSVKPFSIPSQRILNFHVVYSKFLCHVSGELSRSPKADVIETFVEEFCSGFVSKAKDAVLDHSCKGLSKKNEAAGINKLTGGQFYGLVGISFAVARCMVQVQRFDKALAFSKAILSGVGSLCLDKNILDAWTKAVTVFVKCSALGLWTEDAKEVTACQKIWTTAELLETGIDLRDVRKQVFSAKFEKQYTDGYDFALLYLLMDAIGRAVQPLSINCAHLPLATFNFLTREAYSLEEACNKLRGKREVAMKEISLSKALDKQVTFVFIVMRLICDRMNERDVEIDVDINLVAEYCFKTLTSLVDQVAIMEEKKIAEVHARLAQYSTNLAFGFHKRSCFLEAYNWSTKACEVQRMFSSSGTDSDIKLSTLSISLLSAECLKKLGKPEEGLRCLAKFLLVEPTRLETPTVAFDIYEQIPWSDWNIHWIQLQIEARKLNRNFKRTLLELIIEEGSNLINDEVQSQIMRYELNCYFTSRQVVPDAIIYSSEKLIECASNPHDVVLGMLGRAVGYFWGDYDDLLFSNHVINDALLYAETEFSNESDLSSESTPFLLALVLAWKGILLLRKSQYYVEKEMELLKNQLLSENPEKYRDRDTGEERSVSGFSSINYEHETEWTSCLVHATEMLFRFSESDTILKYCSEENCPALVLVTSRIMASILKAVGDVANAAKAWFVVNKLSKVFDRKGLMVLSASEVLKIVPDVEMNVVLEAEMANKIAIETRRVKHSRATCYRICLAKSIAYFHQQMFADGIQQLLKVFRFFDEKDNFDSSHHLLADATYVFSLYRSIQYQNQLDLSKFPETMRLMSPVGLAAKGYKLLCGLTRDIDVGNSGWTDLCHNYYLLGSLMEIGTHALKLLKEAGKYRDLKCFTSDAVNFAQHCGFISRSVGMVVNMIDLDIESKNFYQAQMKIDVISSIFSSSNCLPDEETVAEDEYSKLMANLKLPKLSVPRLESISDVRWRLKQVDLPSMYYRNRSEKVVSTQLKDLREGFDKKDMSVPPWIRHHYSCSCYICSHPTILPVAFRFLLIQARYLSCMAKYKNSMAVLETVKLYIERIIFRLIYNLSPITMPFTVMTSKQSASKAIEIIYTPFSVDPGIESLHHQAMLCPSTDLKLILNAVKKVLQIKSTVAPMDITGKVTAIQLGFSALYRRLVENDELRFTDSEVLAFIQDRIDSQENENIVNLDGTPPMSPKSERAVPKPPVVLKKGIIQVKKGTRTVKESKETVDVEAEERHVPKLPLRDAESVDSVDDSDYSDTSQTSKSSSKSARTHKLVGTSKLVEIETPGLMLEAEKTRSSRNLRSNVTERKKKPS